MRIFRRRAGRRYRTGRYHAFSKQSRRYKSGRFGKYCGSGSFTEAISDDFDCLIVDEAHRDKVSDLNAADVDENGKINIFDAVKLRRVIMETK